VPEPAANQPRATQRFRYGSAPAQFADLWLPDRPDDGMPPAVVVLVHGGFWRNRYDLTLMEPLAADLVDRGYAAWNIEYRRIGDDGGGWPGTLTDVARAVDELAGHRSEVDLARAGFVGHSAGGHLALWAAGRPAIPDDAPGADPAVVPVVAVGQGAVVDLPGAADAPLGSGAVMEFLDGTPADVPQRYEAARPRLDAGPAMVSVVGTADEIVPPSYSSDPGHPGSIELIEVEGADHFDLIDPATVAWDAVVRELDRRLAPTNA
jgi:acetyl esterase/lipase